MNYQTILLEIRDGVAVLTLNRPEKMNSINNLMLMEELPHAFSLMERDDAVKVLILTGAGERAFCAGGDAGDRLVNRMSGKKIESSRFEKIKPVGWLGEMMYRFKKPAIAAINGMTAGAGVAIAMLCDIRICSEKARFSLVFIKRGLTPDCGITYLLPRLVGSAKALELMWTGDIIDARAAESIGLVNRVVRNEDLISEARKFALRLASGPSVAIELTKWAVRKGMENSFENQLDFESRAQHLCMSTEDFKEGVKSFLEKREPHFIGG